jgi:hypothetical protein
MDVYFAHTFLHNRKSEIPINAAIKQENIAKKESNNNRVAINSSVKLQKVTALSHTSVIGTVDHPTLDGGIINAADGIPVFHPEPQAKPAVAHA